MTYDFTGKTALITGGSSGIGLAIAEKLAERGANLWLLARRKEILEQAKAKVTSRKVNPQQQVEIMAVDVTKNDQVSNSINEMIQQSGVPDILINSAGITQPGYFEYLDMETFNQQMDVNYMGMVNTIKAVLPGMIERGSGSIVNIASMSAIISVPGYTAYGASKFAVRGFTESLRSEVQRKGIHIAIVFPPDTETPQLEYDRLHRPAEVDVLVSLDTVLRPEAVAEAILKGITKRKYMIIPGLSNQFFYWLQSLTGTMAYPILDLVFKWAIRKAKQKKPGPNSKTDRE
jgi:3-dehydrosphinganine reductase